MTAHPDPSPTALELARDILGGVGNIYGAALRIDAIRAEDAYYLAVCSSVNPCVQLAALIDLCQSRGIPLKQAMETRIPPDKEARK